ncbi:MAG: hypothetical protein KKI08_16220 [Armatimonadetes bacterium]|nr:hypothetical protein [Armatimonadota bacterium]
MTRTLQQLLGLSAVICVIVLGGCSSAGLSAALITVPVQAADGQGTEPLNANRKAYAVWWMLARLAGWGG